MIKGVSVRSSNFLRRLSCIVLQEADGKPFCVFSVDAESSIAAGTTETQASGDYYGDSKDISFNDGEINQYVNTLRNCIEEHKLS